MGASQEIVERHQGVLRLRSSGRPAKGGTVFQLFLPFEGIILPFRRTSLIALSLRRETALRCAPSPLPPPPRDSSEARLFQAT